MNILFVCENYLPHYGGAEVLFKNLAEGFVQQGHRCTVLTHRMRGTDAEETISGVFVRRVNSFFSRYIFSFFAIPPAISLARRHDLIQTTTFNGAFPAWIAAKITGKPVVLTVHEVWVGKWQEITGFGWLKSTFHDLLERCIYLLPFDKYVCVSEATKKDLLRLGIPPRKVETIYPGLDYDFWDRTKTPKNEMVQLRKKMGAQKKFVYFSWGRPGESKGFEYLIQAVPLIKEKIPHSLLLLMLGSIDKYPQKYHQLLRWSHQLNLPENMKIIPSVSYTELRTYVALADSVVIPSLSEGFGYTAVEAMAMGKPIVVSDAGSLPEIVGGKYQIFRKKDVNDLAEKVSLVALKEYNIKPRPQFPWKETISRYLGVYSALQHRSPMAQSTSQQLTSLP